LNQKIGYENKVLLKKIIEIENKPSYYHPTNVQVKYCPAFESSGYSKNSKKRIMEKDNKVKYIILRLKTFQRRVSSAKPHYCTDKLENSFNNTVYLQTMMAKNRSKIININ